ncbi:bifunctional diguanylate cyclase/phosphodiesterase [Maridesulfovibrio hydrothermalis]|uniref:Diguanylate cyclase n=1 Tax=Maridesulfovibrio hydrothermalis AM13 = DSM 14728 TaxID=1121451 RepID=L0RE45_9BACT|nr:EAL domain-containing protein [Maridesulfovibrio hydrothermalis]CCO25029.1 Diguanylate cyclase [Maridesulfovibrio hydrothermalis AM13 = DSM 14728]
MPLDKILSSLRIRTRLIYTFSLLTVFSLILCGSTIYPLVRSAVQENIEKELTNTTRAMVNMVQAAVDVSVRNHLRAVAEKNLEIITTLYNQYKSGEISEETAKDTAKKLLLGQKIGNTGYIYCLNSAGEIVVHPKNSLIGTDVTNFEFVRKQLENKTGYIEYDWANPGENEIQPKALFMSYFEPWDWIISASSYRNEFDSLVKAEDFRERISAISLGKTGYVFILGPGGETVVHPWVTEPVDNYSDILGQRFLKDIYNKKTGKITYQWKDKDSNKSREKIAVFQDLPEMNWVVAASMYTDEVYEPLDSIIYFVLFSIIVALLLSIPLSAYISNSITIPVDRLVNNFAQVAMGHLETRSKNQSPDEIGILSRRFNEFMDELQGIKCNLNTEVAIRQKSEYQRRLFEEVFNNALEGITITDLNGVIINANPAFTTITGYDVKEVIGKNPSVLKSEKHSKEFYKNMWKDIREKGHWVGEIWNRRKNGESYPELLSISAIHGASGETTHYVAVFHDITEMKSKEEQLKYQAHHDALTGLPNRILLHDRISMAISRAKRMEKKLALFYIDLDNFKTINDSLGHALGDKLLQKATARISRILRSQDTLARLGGDEFVIMVEDISDEFHLIAQAERLLTAFSSPFELDGHELHVTTSIGITLFPDDGEDSGTLIKNADMAMYQAKAEGRNDYHMFRQEMHDRVERRLKIETALRQAVTRDEFVVFYQPKVDIKSGRIYGLEALIRWMRPGNEIVSPAEFIPLAEETGLIIDIGRYVIETACINRKTINDETGQDLIISINVSGRQLKEPELLKDIKDIVATSGCIPEKMELEITESMLMEDVEATVATLDEIAALGFALSIDDFGTGYSSLAYLKKFPINTLKIDRSFIMDITDDKEDARIVQTIIDMSKNLGLEVVAEGVETIEQSQMLKKAGCTKIQGYLYAKPMPLDELIPFLKNWK